MAQLNTNPIRSNGFMNRKPANSIRRLVIVGMAAISASLTTGSIADAAPPHGTLAAAIRTAGLPCAHVIEVQPAGEESWTVHCNSGTYTVARDAQGKLKASR
jgi:hypothetical protein